MRPLGTKLVNDGKIDALVKKAMAAFDALSPEEQRAHRREQAVSWVFGEMKLENEDSPVTREEIADLYDRVRPVRRHEHGGAFHVQVSKELDEAIRNGDADAIGEAMDKLELALKEGL